MTEFKNASSDMRNATRTFMEAKDLVSRVKHARGYFLVVGVGAFDGFQTITPRGSRQTGAGKGASTGMNSQAGVVDLEKGTPSRFPTSIASQIKSDINRNCEGRTSTWNSNSTRSVFALSLNGTSCPGLSKSWDAFGCLFCLCGTIPFSLVSSACVVKCKARLFCWDSDGTRVNSTSFSSTATYTSTVLITENGMKSTKVFHSSTVCSTLNRSMKVTSFRQCTQCPSPSVGVFAEWAAFAVEDVKGYALLDTGASSSVGGYMMVQYVIDCFPRDTAPPRLESADPAVSFTFAEGEKAHSETRIWLPLPGTRHERFAVHIVPSEVTPILLGLDMLREFGLVINTDSAHCYRTQLRVSYSCDSAPIGTLGPCFDAVWKL